MGRKPKPVEVRVKFFSARASGATLKEAAAAAGISRTAGHYWAGAVDWSAAAGDEAAAGAAAVAGRTGDDLARADRQEDAHRHRGRARPSGVDRLA